MPCSRGALALFHGAVLYAAVLVGACAQGENEVGTTHDAANDVGKANDATSDDALAVDGTLTGDSAPTGDTGASVDTGSSAHDTGTSVDTGTVTKDSAPSGLDPNLDLPVGGSDCADPGSLGECPSGEVCRIATTTGGRCEGCTACGNLHAVCSTNDDCDILFQCYLGTCRNICPLGTTYCGSPANCMNVGNAMYGVCKN